MYFKLALKNVKKSYRNYLIYFLTLMFSVAIFYTFNSFENQSVILALDDNMRELFLVLKQVMSILSAVVAVVCGFLILYANNFLIKRRKKELGLYMLLGMKDRNISRILVYETLIIGLLSLVLGLTIGYVLSQGITLLTAKILIVKVNYRFVFSFGATMITIISFLLIFLVVMLFNTRIISRYQLIDLLKSDRMNEELKLKSPMVSVILFIVSLILIGVAYWLGLQVGIPAILYIVVIGSIGTFLFFYSLSGFLLRFIQSRKKMYYKGLNMFVLKQINSKINSTFVSISVICLMLLVAIGAVATGFHMNTFAREELAGTEHFDTTLGYQTTKGEDAKFSEFVDYDKSPVKADYYYTTYDSEISMGIFAPFVGEESAEFLDGREELGLSVIPVSEYNRMMILQGGKPVSLKTNEMALQSLNLNYYDIMDELKDVNVDIYGHNLSLKETYNGGKRFSLYGNYDMFLIVADEIIPPETGGFRLWSMKLKNSEDSKDFAKGLEKNIDQYRRGNPDQVQFSKYEAEMEDEYPVTVEYHGNIESEILGTTMIMTYIGLYLGIIFLMSSVVILALQQLSEADDNQKRYEVLHKLGVSKKMMNRSIFKQIVLYFFLPLGLAAAHTIVGVKVVLTAFNVNMAIETGILPNIFTVVIILSIYLIYFYITYSSSKSIIYAKE